MAAHNAKLTKDMQTFIVVRLACFETLTEVANAFKEEFGTEIDRRHVGTYHPEYPGQRVAKEWRKLFEVTRQQYLTDTASIPVAQQAYRLREIGKLYQRAKQRGADKMAAEFLRQAAEEVGGVYTNKRMLGGGVELTVKEKPASLDDAREILREAGVAK